jgi:para-aminobenzoate synthetase component 1
MKPADASPSPALVHELFPAPSAEDLFLRLCGRPHCLFLDSAMRHPGLGRYSFLAADPFDYWELPADAADGLAHWAARTAPFAAATLPGLPPFQGGAAGLLGYELGRSLEQLPAARCDEFAVPALALGLYDVVVAIDHQASRAWVVSQGFPELEPARRRQRAERRLAEFLRLLQSPPPPLDPGPANPSMAIPRAQLAPQFPLPGFANLTSNFSRPDYLRAVRRVVDYIVAGDVFQVNLGQRLLHPARDGSPALYLRLRQRNPAPFAGYFDLGQFQVVSASPERFVQVRGDQVETRPIKGTRPRSGDPATDRHVAAELRASAKDRAENVMIVDLLRNDLSRVCRPESVCVSRLCDVETYAHVLHLVSTLRGRLREGRRPLDLLRAAFPGGSITGAPKVRAMEIIAELEPTARGAYCGALGYLGFDGAMDLSILIRTITAGRGWWQAPVGGGIIAASVAEQEYQETLDKAQGLIQAMNE